MKHRIMYLFAMMLLSCRVGVFGQDGQNTYKLVTSESQLEADGVYLIASSADAGDAYVLSSDNGNNRKGNSVTIADASIVCEVATKTGDNTHPYELTLGGKIGAWTFFDAVNNAYLNVTDDKSLNCLRTIGKLDTYAYFSIAISDGGIATIKATKKTSKNWLLFNADSHLFNCYSDGQKDVYLYKKVDDGGETPVDPVITVEKPTISPNTGSYYGVQTVTIEAEDGCKIYYTTDGSSPSTSSLVYEESFVVSETTTIKAVAVNAEGNMSQEASVVIMILKQKLNGTFELPYTYDEVNNLTNLPTKSVWVKGYVVGYIDGGNDGKLTAEFKPNDTGTNKLKTLGIGHLDAVEKRYIPISLSDETKSVLNLYDNRHNFGKEFYAYGPIETYWGMNGIKTLAKAICRDCSSPYGYIVAGSGFKDTELDFVFSDANATSIDLRACIDDVSSRQILSPNTLIIKDKNEERADNVIVKNGTDYFCQRLVLNNGYAFRAPFDFVAGEATYTMSISAAGYATLCLPFSCSVPDGLTAYKLESIKGKEVIAVEADALEANMPVLLKGEQGEYTFSATNVSVSADENMVNGILKGVYSRQKVEAKNYVLQMHDNEPAFYIVADGKEPTVNPFRAYMTSVSLTANLFTLKIVDKSEIDGVQDAVEDGTSVVEEYYNIYGVRLSAPEKGVNIIRMSNGDVKKIFIK
ncbi:MAG: chitobiase/beta-hexosaminidase C-terminal domain-containing protein [Prevotellaceae bacterium]|nr:chitobiase/beta-hexosaminidase C-terminal domain-containing protein [Prevotellaceae bacterium]